MAPVFERDLQASKRFSLVYHYYFFLLSNTTASLFSYQLSVFLLLVSLVVTLSLLCNKMS